MENWRNISKSNKYYKSLENAWKESKYKTIKKLTEFSKYVPKPSLMQFLARYELYKLIEW